MGLTPDTEALDLFNFGFWILDFGLAAKSTARRSLTWSEQSKIQNLKSKIEWVVGERSALG